MRGLPRREAAVLHELKATFGGELRDADPERSVPAPAPAKPHVFTLVANQHDDHEDRVLRMVDELKKQFPDASWVLGDTSRAEVDAALRAEAQLVPVTVIPRVGEDADQYRRDDLSLVRDSKVTAAATVIYVLDDGPRARYYKRRAQDLHKPCHDLGQRKGPPPPKKRRATKQVTRD